MDELGTKMYFHRSTHTWCGGWAVVPCNRSRGLEYGVDAHWGLMNGRRSGRSDRKAALYVHMVMLIVELVFLNPNLRILLL